MTHVFSFPVRQPSNDAVFPSVVRYLEAEHVDSFFATGELRLSTCKAFWHKESELLGDVHESLIRISASFGDGGPFSMQTSAATNMLVLCASCVEDLGTASEYSTAYNSAIRIVDPVNFAIAVAQCIPNYIGGFHSYCIYRDSRHVELEDFGLAFPSSAPPESIEDFMGWRQKIESFVAPRAITRAMLQKGLKYRSQNEYRFVWQSPDVKDLDFLTIQAPQAIQFCKRITNTPVGPDLTVNIMGAEMTMLTRFDANDPDKFLPKRPGGASSSSDN